MSGLVDGQSCPGCGLSNYSGLCPVCRGDESAYVEELQPHFGPWKPDWSLPPEPVGEDEEQVRAFYFRMTEGQARKDWGELEDWQRESWRREFHDR